MTRLVASCGCTYSTSMGERKPERCKKHKTPFVLASSVRKEHEVVEQPASFVAMAGQPKTSDHHQRQAVNKRPRDNGGPAQRNEDIGNPRRSQKPRRRKAGLKRTEPKRDWSLAQAKKEEEGCCRICKRTDRPLEFAHILGREHDEPKLGTDGRPLKELIVLPDRGIPACGPYPEGCHGAMHRKEVDVLRYLTLEEQVQAVRDAGSVEAARLRLTWAPGVAA